MPINALPFYLLATGRLMAALGYVWQHRWYWWWNPLPCKPPPDPRCKTRELKKVEKKMKDWGGGGKSTGVPSCFIDDTINHFPGGVYWLISSQTFLIWILYGYSRVYFRAIFFSLYLQSYTLHDEPLITFLKDTFLCYSHITTRLKSSSKMAELKSLGPTHLPVHLCLPDVLAVNRHLFS